MSATSNVARLKPETEDSVRPTGLALLREPFPENLISKLPKETGAQIKARKENGRSTAFMCPQCGSWHHKDAIHLDYVGHAALTHRLLDADPHWSWEPAAFTPEGLPAFDRNGGLWIKLTVCGVTRLGYGNAEVKANQDAGAREKEVIGDALRNAGMRFGAALDLWHKGDLHVSDEPPPPSALERATEHLRSASVDRGLFSDSWNSNKAGWKEVLNAEDYRTLVEEMKNIAATFPAPTPPPQPPPSKEPFALLDDEIPF